MSEKNLDNKGRWRNVTIGFRVSKEENEATVFGRHYLDKLLETGKLKRTEPEKTKSKNQKYYS